MGQHTTAMSRAGDRPVPFGSRTPPMRLAWSFTYGGGPHRFTDSDYLKKFHGDFADADELAALLDEHGFEAGEWNRLYGIFNSGNRQHETGLPSLGGLYTLVTLGY